MQTLHKKGDLKKKNQWLMMLISFECSAYSRLSEHPVIQRFCNRFQLGQEESNFYGIKAKM